MKMKIKISDTLNEISLRLAVAGIDAFATKYEVGWLIFVRQTFAKKCEPFGIKIANSVINAYDWGHKCDIETRGQCLIRDGQTIFYPGSTGPRMDDWFYREFNGDIERVASEIESARKTIDDVHTLSVFVL